MNESRNRNGTSRILVVDDSPDDLNLLRRILREHGYTVHSAPQGDKALQAVETVQPDLVLLDVNMPGINGYEVCEQIKSSESTRDISIIFISAADQVLSKVKAFFLGGVDYILKPFQTEEVLARVNLHLSLLQLRRDLEERVRQRTADLMLANERLKEEIDARARAEEEVKKHRDHLEALVKDRTAELILVKEKRNRETSDFKIIGKTSSMNEIRQRIASIAPTNAPILITGETGTGKEMVAQAIHDCSPRRSKPFVALNCGALPESIFESEMFGAESGAYTGLSKRRIGKLEYASGGTLFLDEIESMPPILQVKLLRVLQNGVIERLGSNEPIKIDVRIVAAVKGDLLALSNEGKFRSDLYYRLNVVTIDLPPLRERRDDIPVLFEHFTLEAAVRYGRPAPLLSQAQLLKLMTYHWPGNVRELRNVADRFVLGVSNAHPGFQGQPPATKTLPQQIEDFEKTIIEAELRNQGHVVTRTAKSLGISRSTLISRINQYKLTSEIREDDLSEE